MKKLLGILLCVSAMAFAAEAPKSIAQIYGSDMKSAAGEIIGLAKAMPEGKYSFAPTSGEFKGVRTFGQQMKHIAAVNYQVAAAIIGEKSPVEAGKGENGPDSIATKDQIVKFLEDSFAYAQKAVGGITSSNLTEPINSPFGDGKTTRAAMATVPAWHSFDHYGQAVVYARMNGVIPPASRH